MKQLIFIMTLNEFIDKALIILGYIAFIGLGTSIVFGLLPEYLKLNPNNKLTFKKIKDGSLLIGLIAGAIFLILFIIVAITGMEIKPT